MSYQTKENFNCLMSFEVTRDFHINIPLTDGYWLDKFQTGGKSIYCNKCGVKKE